MLPLAQSKRLAKLGVVTELLETFLNLTLVEAQKLIAAAVALTN